MRRFDGKVVFVTGAAHGIGRAIAGRLTSEGARLVLADLDLAAAELAARQLSEAEAAATPLAVACDITSRDSVDAAIAQAVQAFGRLDVLVNNAGLGSGRPFAEADDAEFTQQLDLNLAGAVRCIQAALPHLVGSGGNVVSIGSVNGIAAFGDVTYSMAKAGLHHLVTNLTAEYGPQGVRFNVVAPGTIRTRVWDGREDMLQRLAESVYPLRRVGEPEDVAAAVAFLASDDAGWISGVVLPVDGGVLSGPIASAYLSQGDR